MLAPVHTQNKNLQQYVYSTPPSAQLLVNTFLNHPVYGCYMLPFTNISFESFTNAFVSSGSHRHGEGDKASLIFLASRISTQKYVRINAIFQNRYTLDERAKWVSRTNKSDLNGSNTVNTYISCVFPQDKRRQRSPIYMPPSLISYYNNLRNKYLFKLLGRMLIYIYTRYTYFTHYSLPISTWA